ncbi:hypothetical protein ACFWNK_38395 [Streptomyces sp. NPDC058417]|uniref:hypothetical protein n=1 Tax=unclassified Streptomyces TaxID=2593676 RepID=UPI003656BFD8
MTHRRPLGTGPTPTTTAAEDSTPARPTPRARLAAEQLSDDARSAGPATAARPARRRTLGAGHPQPAPTQDTRPTA